MKPVLLAALLTLGLGGTPSPGVVAQSTAKDFPVPPVPPEHPPAAETAPVPDADARAPLVPPSASPSFDVKLYRARPYDPGFGFAPGSRYQTSEDRKPIQTPGLSISVPLQ